MEKPTEILDVLGGLTAAAAALLAGVGLKPGPLAIQAILFALAATALAVVVVRVLRGDRTLPAWLGVVLLGLVALYVPSMWALQLVVPLPDFVAGRIEADHYRAMRVELLGFEGRSIPPGPDEVDSRGVFGVQYPPTLGDWPRLLRITRPDCAPQEETLSRERLRSGEDLVIQFQCREPS